MFSLAPGSWGFQQSDKLRKELQSPYQAWLTTDVAYIITDAEKKAFSQLGTDEERDQFIEQFWLRRDPTPDTVENEYKEEHYRRIAFANDHFASGMPGWKTDRGRLYIVYGPPDEIESHPSGGGAYPFEQWRYRHIDGVGDNVMVEFVDSTMSGEYRMTIDPHDKDAFRYVPGAQPQMLSAEASPRPGTNEFDGIEKYAKLSGPPKVKFADLEAAVNSTVSYNMLPIKVLNSSIPLTSDTTMNTLTVQIERGGLLFQEHNGKTRAIVDIYGRVSTLSRRVVQTFEDVVELDGPANLPAIYQKAIALQPGKYRLNLAIKDAAGGGLSTYDVALDLPALVPDRLSASSLILADAMEHASMSGIGAGQFVIGDMKVRPRIDAVFERGEKLGIYQRLYNLSLDESTQKTNASVEYRIEESGSHKAVLEFTEDIEKFTSQHVVEKLLPLASVGHGTFLLSLKVDDRISGQTVASSATFTVR